RHRRDAGAGLCRPRRLGVAGRGVLLEASRAAEATGRGCVRAQPGLGRDGGAAVIRLRRPRESGDPVSLRISAPRGTTRHQEGITMLVEVKVPVLSESVSEATLVSWHKKQGEPVQRDENLIDIETDKVVLELPAPESGVLAEIKKGDGATVAAEEVIAVIDTAAKATVAAQSAAEARPAPAAAQSAAPA